MKTRLRIAALGVVLAIVPLVSSCSHEPVDPVASARELPDAPAWVSKPSGLDCGDVQLEADFTLPAKNLECLVSAGKVGQAAFLTWTLRTTEGDPIPHFARTTGSGVAVASTSAYDKYGGGGWTETTCATAAALPGCAD